MKLITKLLPIILLSLSLSAMAALPATLKIADLVPTDVKDWCPRADEMKITSVSTSPAAAKLVTAVGSPTVLEISFDASVYFQKTHAGNDIAKFLKRNARIAPPKIDGTYVYKGTLNLDPHTLKIISVTILEAKASKDADAAAAIADGVAKPEIYSDRLAEHLKNNLPKSNSFYQSAKDIQAQLDPDVQI